MKTKVIKSNRKTISLSVDDGLNAVVRAPYGTSNKQIEDFVKANSAWLEKTAEKKKAYLKRTNLSEEKKHELIARAKEIIPERVEYYSDLMDLCPAGIKITSAKKRFGSCSPKNSLCFSYYLMLYPDEAIDYVVVHELAHIKHHNHSKSFYSLIEEYMPDYRKREKLLKS